MKLSEMKIDPVRFEQGAWVENIPEMGELKLKVRGIGNADFRRKQTRLMEAEPRKNKLGGRLSQERQDAITAQCMIHTVLIDWSGVLDDDGKQIPYSIELATELLTKPEYRRFKDAVSYAATIVGEDLGEAADDVGNGSKQRSTGT